MARLTLKLNIKERDALFKLAERERRDPRAQAAFIIRQELERRGLLPVKDGATQNDTTRGDALGVRHEIAG